ncbi:transcriptional regulator [Pleomorphomonas diazotrophica]|uniref:Transcriptional regulator n=1 Tax=Pleomorphomonas diazotrophica TaxID=1166257 RepID=A0A1I4QB39_9HYPH|nr:helix-turn-helix domain-containing protein [Pleomorphomonas diazotrophica]PKR90799.1 transcriptional regulator [Pleomorphomonas diazotrophica]SFM37298.1 DNA-binding transcriptional regulator, HxlR family [Pleomorphomonas diazotrophica]
MRRRVECPYEATYDLIKGKWTICILNQLAVESRGFNEFLRLNPDLSPKVLTQKLKALEEGGIVRRQIHSTSPPSSEYSLTALGNDLMPLMGAMESWGRRYLAQTEELAQETDTSGLANGKGAPPLRPLPANMGEVS